MKQEAVVEQQEKEAIDRQWERYRRQRAPATSGAPTERQKAYIVDLAKRIGMRVDVSAIRSCEAASRIIGTLRQIDARMHGALQRI